MIQNTNEQIADHIVMEFAKTAELFGLTTLEARLFAYMYLEDKPLTLDEMSEAMGKSKTSMSNGVRGLLDLKLVNRVWIKGVRKDLYHANAPLFKIFMDAYLQKWDDATKHQREALMSIKETIEHDPELSANTKGGHMEQLEQMIQFHNAIKSSFNQLKNDPHMT
ncbi:GbsR/MarR family transcriptional regulator [Lentibacillus saliphilus]|uniref:GbsR/MarR family transcriptional regulator n=1 Tax=Lentibacillus saliphilus TaxID=2737028 RepID=UPI001C301A78|nr:transcriptional regulator [Lentibacillus saliphilus]